MEGSIELIVKIGVCGCVKGTVRQGKSTVLECRF